MAIYGGSSKERCHGNFVNKIWQEHDLYSLCYGRRRNILIENLYDHNFPSKKYYKRPDIGNVVIIKSFRLSEWSKKLVLYNCI